MQKIGLFILVWIASWAGHQAVAEEPAPKGHRMGQLVDASAEDLTELQAQASAEIAALRALMSNGQPQPDATLENEADKPVHQPRKTRDDIPREAEDSFATVLPVATATEAQQAFSQLNKAAAAAQMPSQLVPQVEAFVAQYPQHRDGRLLLARLQMLGHQAESVVDVVSPLLTPIYRQNHPDWQPWFWAGTAHLATGNVLLARDHLEVALSKQGRKVEIWVQLAVVQQELDNHAAALQYLDVAGQLDPNFADVYLNRAYSYEHLGQYPDALKAYQRFLVAGTYSSSNLKPAVMRRVALLTQMSR
ncbi:MAG: tetratricopeptide repeat protein [Pseudomonadota bacterium]